MEYIHDEDNWFTIAIERPEPDSLYVDFKVYEIHSLGDTPDQHGYGDNGYVELAALKDNAVDPDIHGSVKWDGCSNLWFKNDCFHFCAKEQAQRVGVMLGRVYDEAARLMGEKWLK